MPSSPRNPGSESIEAYLESLQTLHDRLDEGISFSGHERNRVFLNCAGRGFANASTVAGLDFLDDARGLAFFDWDHDGDLDLVLSNRTAPRLRLMRNSSPATKNWVSLVLEGDGETSNRDAIGARVAVKTSGGTLLRTVRAGEGFLSQSSLRTHFGLGDDSLRGDVTVHWPGGTAETFAGVEAGGRYRLVQNAGRALRLQEPPRRLAVRASEQAPHSPTTGKRVVLATRPPAPVLTMRPFASENLSGRQTDVPINAVGKVPVLLNFWASWCLPCREELGDFTAQADSIRAAGLEIVALSTDGLGYNPQTRPQDGQELMDRLRFPFPHGLATAETLDKVEIIQRFLFDRSFPLALPFSLLIDAQGGVAALYRGGVETADLIADLSILEAPAAELRALAVPFEGRWFQEPSDRASIRAYARWFEARFPDESVALLQHAASEATAELEGTDTTSFDRSRARNDLYEAYRGLATLEKKRGDHAASVGYYRSVLELEPVDEGARAALLNVLFEAGRVDEVRSQVEAWLAEDPSQADLHVRLAEVHDKEGRLEAASRELIQAVGLDPDAAGLRYLLGQTYAKQDRAREAMAQFEATLRLAPEHEPAHLALAGVSASEGQTEQAVAHYSRVLEINPRNPDALYALAKAYVAAGRVARALPLLETLTDAAPENAAAHYELGVTLLRLGRLGEGVEHVRRAIALDERFVPAANNVARVLATRPEADLRDGAGALLIARELNARTGHRELAYLETLAVAFAETGDFDAAVRTTETAIEIARQTGESQALSALTARLELFLEGRPARGTNG